MNLRTKLTLFFVGIVAVPLVAATVAFQVVAGRQADARTDTRLRTAAAAVETFWEERLTVVRRDVSLAAEELAPELDAAALADRVRELRAETGLDFLVVGGSRGGTRAAALGAAAFPEVPPFTPAALIGAGEPPGVLRAIVEILHGDRTLLVVGGRYADLELASQLERATGLGVAVVADGTALAAAGPRPVSIPGPGEHVEGDGRYSLLVPTGAPGQGIVLTVVSETGWSGLAWLVGLAGLLAATGLGYALAGVIARPLERLVEGARAVAAGDLDTRVDTGDRGDVAHVAEAFNTMTEYIRTYVEELRASRDELRGSLDRLGATLRTTLDLSGMLEVVLDTAAVTLGARAGALFLFRGGTRHLRLEVARGYEPPADAMLVVGEGIAGRAAATGAAVLVQQGGPPAPDPVEPAAATAVAVPLVRGERSIGVVALYGRTALEPFHQEDAETLASFAGQASVAIENVLLHQETRQLSITDGLTGVWNRRYLDMTLRKEIERAQRFGRPLSVVMLDIDRFKTVNDRYGHQRGDEVLIEVTRRILGEIRTNIDVVGRYGGDEFVVVLPETPASGARVVAEKIRAGMRDEPFAAGSPEPVEVTVSMGVARYPEDGPSAEELIHQADAAMYRAKAEGRDRVVATSA